MTVHISGYYPTDNQSNSENSVVTSSGALNYNILRNDGRSMTIKAREIHLNNLSLTPGVTIIRAGEFTDSSANVPQTPPNPVAPMPPVVVAPPANVPQTPPTPVTPPVAVAPPANVPQTPSTPVNTA